MTKITGKDCMTTEELFDSLPNSPYYQLALQYLKKKGFKKEEINILHVLDAMYVIAKVNDKLNDNEINFENAHEYAKKIERK